MNVEHFCKAGVTQLWLKYAKCLQIHVHVTGGRQRFLIGHSIYGLHISQPHPLTVNCVYMLRNITIMLPINIIASQSVQEPVMVTITNGLASGPLCSVKAVELLLFFEDSVFLLELLTVVPVVRFIL